MRVSSLDERGLTSRVAPKFRNSKTILNFMLCTSAQFIRFCLVQCFPRIIKPKYFYQNASNQLSNQLIAKLFWPNFRNLIKQIEVMASRISVIKISMLSACYFVLIWIPFINISIWSSKGRCQHWTQQRISMFNVFRWFRRNGSNALPLPILCHALHLWRPGELKKLYNI